MPSKLESRARFAQAPPYPTSKNTLKRKLGSPPRAVREEDAEAVPGKVLEELAALEGGRHGAVNQANASAHAPFKPHYMVYINTSCRISTVYSS